MADDNAVVAAARGLEPPERFGHSNWRVRADAYDAALRREDPVLVASFGKGGQQLFPSSLCFGPQ